MSKIVLKSNKEKWGIIVFILFATNGILLGNQNCTRSGFKQSALPSSSEVIETLNAQNCIVNRNIEWSVGEAKCATTGFVLSQNSQNIYSNILNDSTGSIEFRCTNGQLIELNKSCQKTQTGAGTEPTPAPTPVTPAPAQPTPGTPQQNCLIYGISVAPGPFSVVAGYKLSVIYANGTQPNNCDQVRDSATGTCNGTNGEITLSKAPAFFTCRVEAVTGPCPITSNTGAIVFGNPLEAACRIDLNQVLATGGLPPRNKSNGVVAQASTQVLEQTPGTGKACLICDADKVVISANPTLDCASEPQNSVLNQCQPIHCNLAANYQWEACRSSNSAQVLSWNQEIKLTASLPTGYSGATTLKCNQVDGRLSTVTGSQNCNSPVAENRYQYLTLVYQNKTSTFTIIEGDDLNSPVVIINDCLVGTSNCRQSNVPVEDLNWSLSKRPPGVDQEIQANICNAANCGGFGSITTALNNTSIIPANSQLVIYGSIRASSPLFGQFSGLGGSFILNIVDQQ